MKINFKELYKTLFKKSISENKIQFDQQNSFGKIAVAKSKEEMIANRGFTCGSIETLLENKVITHITPNAYYHLSRQNGVVEGHQEGNLKQINTFVIDIDTKAVTPQDILLATIENDEIMPTFIISTTNGYHVYFVLDKPVYVTNKTNYKSLKVAKKISINLRKTLSRYIDGVDFMCNHFGYFRAPNKDNIEYINLDNTHNFKELIHWSQKQMDDEYNRLKLVVDNTFNHEQKQIKEAWYSELFKQVEIHSGAGLGRNNTMFTLALANYQSGVDEVDCLNKLDEFNSRLNSSLSYNDVKRIVTSAYSGRYKGAQKEYIDTLMQSWCEKSYKTTTFNTFTKHKKSRDQRVYSHAEEREQDIIDYINKHNKKGVVEISINALTKVFNVSKTSILNAINKSNKIFRKTIGVGRFSKTIIYTVHSLLNYLNMAKKKRSTIVTVNELEEVNQLYALLPARAKLYLDDLIDIGQQIQYQQVRLLL